MTAPDQAAAPKGPHMSNINPNPSFEPTPGKPTAAPAHFPYKHRNMATAKTHEERKARDQQLREEREGKCRVCKGQSPEWKSGACVCGNTGLAQPPRSA